MCNTAKTGDWIRWSFPDTVETPKQYRGKTFKAQVVLIDYRERHYCVYADYGQDLIPFEEAILL